MIFHWEILHLPTWYVFTHQPTWVAVTNIWYYKGGKRVVWTIDAYNQYKYLLWGSINNFDFSIFDLSLISLRDKVFWLRIPGKYYSIILVTQSHVKYYMDIHQKESIHISYQSNWAIRCLTRQPHLRDQFYIIIMRRCNVLTREVDLKVIMYPIICINQGIHGRSGNKTPVF